MNEYKQIALAILIFTIFAVIAVGYLGPPDVSNGKSLEVFRAVTLDTTLIDTIEIIEFPVAGMYFMHTIVRVHYADGRYFDIEMSCYDTAYALMIYIGERAGI